MNFLSVENLSKTWHDKPVLRNITFGIQQGEKVALVAGNGQGKSTLLQIIIGKESADTGKAIMRKDIKVGYLPQEPELFDFGLYKFEDNVGDEFLAVKPWKQ
mgnify:CR=1 FL=1